MKTRRSSVSRKKIKAPTLKIAESVLQLFPPVSRMGGSKPSDWKSAKLQGAVSRNGR